MENYRNDYVEIISRMELPKDVSLDQFEHLIVEMDSSLETVTLRMEGESDTTKLSNLRFRLKELVKLIIKTGADVWGGNPLVILLKSVEFIQEAKKLSKILLSKDDAKVLAAIWLVKLEKSSKLWPNNEEIRKYLEGNLTEDIIEMSLNKLEILGCIKREDDQIKIEEEVRF